MVDKRCANILKMSEDKTLEFISLYAKEECLWKTDSEFYTNKTARSIATQNIAEAIDLPDFKAKHVMIKFRNLRNSYCQELKKIAASIELGGEYRPKLFWFNLMDSFLRNYLKKPRFDEVMEHKLNENLGENVSNDNLYNKMNNNLKFNVNNNVNNIIKNNVPVALMNPAAYGDENWYVISEPEPAEEVYNEEDLTATITNEVLESLEHINEQPRKEDFIDPLLLNKDYFDEFGQYVSSLLRALPLKKAMALKPQIINLITNSALDAD